MLVKRVFLLAVILLTHGSLGQVATRHFAPRYIRGTSVHGHRHFHPAMAHCVDLVCAADRTESCAFVWSVEHSAGDEDSLHFQQAAASCHPAYLKSDPVPDPLFTAIMSNVFQNGLGYPGSSMASKNGLYYVSGPEVFQEQAHFVVRGPGKIVFWSHKTLRLKLGQVAKITLHDVSVPATMIQGQRVRAFNITGLGELEVAGVVYDLGINKDTRFEPAEGMIKAEDSGCNFVPLLQHQGCLAYEPPLNPVSPKLLRSSSSRDIKTGDELPPYDDDWYGRNRGSTSQQSSTRILDPGEDIASDAEGVSGEGYQKNQWRTSSGLDDDDSDNSGVKSPQSTDYEEQLKKVAAGNVWDISQSSDLEGLSGEGYTVDKWSAAGQQPKYKYPSESTHDALPEFNLAETEGVTGEGYGKNQWNRGGHPTSDNSSRDKVPSSKSRSDGLVQPNMAEAEGVTGEGYQKATWRTIGYHTTSDDLPDDKVPSSKPGNDGLPQISPAEVEGLSGQGYQKNQWSAIGSSSRSDAGSDSDSSSPNRPLNKSPSSKPPSSNSPSRNSPSRNSPSSKSPSSDFLSSDWASNLARNLHSDLGYEDDSPTYCVNGMHLTYTAIHKGAPIFSLLPGRFMTNPKLNLEDQRQSGYSCGTLKWIPYSFRCGTEFLSCISSQGTLKPSVDDHWGRQTKTTTVPLEACSVINRAWPADRANMICIRPVNQGGKWVIETVFCMRELDNTGVRCIPGYRNSLVDPNH